MAETNKHISRFSGFAAHLWFTCYFHHKNVGKHALSDFARRGFCNTRAHNIQYRGNAHQQKYVINPELPGLPFAGTENIPFCEWSRYAYVCVVVVTQQHIDYSCFNCLFHQPTRFNINFFYHQNNEDIFAHTNCFVYLHVLTIWLTPYFLIRELTCKETNQQENATNKNPGYFPCKTTHQIR